MATLFGEAIGGRKGATVLVIVRADQDAVDRALAGHNGYVEIGPTSPTGWTATWIDPMGVQRLSSLGETLSVFDEDEDLRIELATESGILKSSVPLADDSPGRTLVLALENRFAPRDCAETLGEALRAVTWDVDVVGLLDRFLELPQLEEATPSQQVIGFRGNPTTARLVARVSGPALLRVHRGGWVSLACVDGDHEDGPCLSELACALSATTSRRGSVLVLWRARGAGAGIQVFRDGFIEGVISWNTGWVRLDVDASSADHVARLLIDDIPGAVDSVALRALLRARARRADPLREIVEILQVPGELLAVLDSEPGLQVPQHVERVAGWHAWWQEMAIASPPMLPKPVRMAVAILSVVWLLGCVFITSTFVAVVATDGAFVDEDHATRGDWALLFCFAALTVAGLFVTRWRFRRARL